MKAVVELGGKQYLVEPGTIFLTDSVEAEKGQSYSTDRVLLILDGDDIVLGKPYIENARVLFSVLDQTKRRKIIVQKYRPKTGYLRTVGHRQPASQLQVELIEGGGKREERVVEKKKKAKKPRAKKAEVKVEEPSGEPEPEAEVKTEL
jgi:large subunit ribosomal protein L21